MDNQNGYGGGWQGVFWWAMLVVAVLAVPAIGIIVWLMTDTRGFFGVAIFMVSCWISTYLGMKLMHRVEKK